MHANLATFKNRLWRNKGTKLEINPKLFTNSRSIRLPNYSSEEEKNVWFRICSIHFWGNLYLVVIVL